MSAAPRMMMGNGTSKKKMPMKAAAARTRIVLFFSERLPIRTTASRHDREHGGLESEEQRDDHRHIAVGGIDVAQRHDGDDAGHHEQRRRR